MCIQAELVFFPSLVPLRAIIKKQIASNHVALPIGLANWQEVTALLASQKAQLPFTTNSPIIIQHLLPVEINNEWFLQDAMQAIMPIEKADSMIWKLLAISGGQGLQMAVLAQQHSFLPIGVWANDTYISL